LDILMKPDTHPDYHLVKVVIADLLLEQGCMAGPPVWAGPVQSSGTPKGVPDTSEMACGALSFKRGAEGKIVVADWLIL
jgi:hypothetical protein